jgi:hypothetical protein
MQQKRHGEAGLGQIRGACGYSDYGRADWRSGSWGMRRLVC